MKPKANDDIMFELNDKNSKMSNSGLTGSRIDIEKKATPLTSRELNKRPKSCKRR